MAEIQGIGNMTKEEISFELNRGGKFVVYHYCFSALIVTVMQSTDVYFIRAQESRVGKSMPWTLLTLVAGWWGIPWGPIRTIQSLWTNLHGGKDVTATLANAMQLPSVDWVAISGGRKN
jgi:hypothetical protein